MFERSAPYVDIYIHCIHTHIYIYIKIHIWIDINAHLVGVGGDERALLRG